MRIAYLLAWRAGRASGPFRKMVEQAEAWRDSGHDVRLFVVTDPGSAADWASLAVPTDVIAGPGDLVSVTRARTRQAQRARAWGPDLVYLRHGAWAPGYGRLLRAAPGVLEVNGDEVLVMQSRSRLRATYAKATRGLLLRAARGAVFVTEELSRAPAFARYDLPTLVLGNGLRMADFRTLPPSGSAAPRLVLLAHPHSPWHGVDKLAELARREPTWTIDLVGPALEDVGSPPPANLVLHGWADPATYLPLLQGADIGIGALAMHRVGIREASALKVREYLARGLPVLSGCADPDIDPGSPWYLELPNTEDNVTEGIDRIREFVATWHGKRVPRAEVEHLDSEAKEQRRLRFFEEVLARG